MTDLLTLALATWRLAYMLVKETGPAAIFERARADIPHGGLLHCVYCASVWCALLLWLLWSLGWRWPVRVLAGSGLAVLLHRYVGFDYAQ